MGRKLAEATNACRTLRTRGETGLRFLATVDAPAFRLAEFAVLDEDEFAAPPFLAPVFVAVLPLADLAAEL
jgi:hypothetical protein